MLTSIDIAGILVVLSFSSFRQGRIDEGLTINKTKSNSEIISETRSFETLAPVECMFLGLFEGPIGLSSTDPK